MIYWLELLKATDFLNEKEFENIYNDGISILKLITSILKTTKAQVIGKGCVVSKNKNDIQKFIINNLQSTIKMIVLITGGERSGKSSYAENLAKELSATPIYVATARNWDDDFQKRIDRHQKDRDERWINIEKEKQLSEIDFTGKVAVIDCVTLWLTNFFVDTKNDVELCLEQAKAEFEAIANLENAKIIIITNEIGMGVHAQTHIGRKFTELQGWMNQYIAKKADTVVLMVSGIPVTIKGQL